MSGPIIAHQFWIQSPGCGEIRQTALGELPDGEVLVKARYSGISRGTEALVFGGHVPVSQYDEMRAPFQEGEFPGPVKYGYSSVGEVVAGPAGWHGRTVFCLYPHQDLYPVPVSAVALVPADVPAGRAVLAANMETAINVAWDARPTVGDRIVVVGGGVVGLLVAWLCRQMAGVDLTVVDPNPRRGSVADALGLQCVTDPPAGTEADVVIHASGRPEGLVAALNLAGTEATIVEASWYGTREVPLPLGERFHAQRLTLRSSQVGRLAPAQVPRWTHRRRLALALTLLRAAELDALISGESRFVELPTVMAALTQEPGDTLCHRIRYEP